jgi:hypothetical protein
MPTRLFPGRDRYVYTGAKWLSETTKMSLSTATTVAYYYDQFFKRLR